MNKIYLLEKNNVKEKNELLYTAKNVFSTEKYKLCSYLLYDGTEYVELTNYKNDFLGNYEIGKVLTFSKINCLDNFNGYDNFKKNKG